MQVRDAMSGNPICVNHLATVAEARAAMVRHRIRRLPVVHEGRLVGIITSGDLRGASPWLSLLSGAPRDYEKQVAGLEVGVIMRRNPIVIAPDAALEEAARVMARCRIGGLPVVSRDLLVGILTTTDALRALVKLLDEGRGAEGRDRRWGGDEVEARSDADGRPVPAVAPGAAPDRRAGLTGLPPT